MWLWIASHWGWFVAAIVLGVYFACYVLAIRHARDTTAPDSGERFRLPCDRC